MTQPHRSETQPTPPPKSDAGPVRSQSGADEFFVDAADDFGLKPRPKFRRPDPLIGTDLGGIRITRLLGEGGMGRVYEAQQISPARTVAVKVVRQGIVSEKTMRRFEREAEFLGRLQHPCIAQIYVVGSYSSDDGDVPFFVMEYIPNAMPINSFAADKKLSLDDRLRLFISVCEAVAHGHDRGIVHRDLKPGNILIDAEGLPKVIDFGVARSTDSDFSLTSMKTDTGQLVGTVQYMSPEQFGDSPEGLDGRADVYSLGVVLYELLSGVLPYEVRKKKMHEAARIICEDIPPSLRMLDRSVPRDVSLVVERCLEKNRRARYQGAAALAADLRQCLAGERLAVSWKDRLRPLARATNHRWLPLVIAGIIGLITVMAFVTRLQTSATQSEAVSVSAAIPPPLAEALQESLQESVGSLRTSTGNMEAAMKHAQEHVDMKAREIQKDECNGLVNRALPEFVVMAEKHSRQLGRAWVDASKAYPAASETELSQRSNKWRQDFDSLCSAAKAELEAVKQECTEMISAAEASTAEGALPRAEQSIRNRLESWQADWSGRLGALVTEASQDLLFLARESAVRGGR